MLKLPQSSLRLRTDGNEFISGGANFEKKRSRTVLKGAILGEAGVCGYQSLDGSHQDSADDLHRRAKVHDLKISDENPID